MKRDLDHEHNMVDLQTQEIASQRDVIQRLRGESQVSVSECVLPGVCLFRMKQTQTREMDPYLVVGRL